MFGTSCPDVPVALDERAASNLVCVCCNCDRVRARSGEWCDDITPHPGDRRSHGICPGCFVVLYPEYAELVETR